MAKCTIILSDRNFRITVPYEIRIAENLKIGDVIEIDVVKYSSIKDEFNNIKETVKEFTKLITKERQNYEKK